MLRLHFNKAYDKIASFQGNNEGNNVCGWAANRRFQEYGFQGGKSASCGFPALFVLKQKAEGTL
jgi:hypothetical protein